MGSGSSKDRPRDFCCPHKANLKKGQSQFGFAPIVSLNTVIRLGQGGPAEEHYQRRAGSRGPSGAHNGWKAATSYTPRKWQPNRYSAPKGARAN